MADNEATSHHLTVPKTARYFKLSSSDLTADVWIVLHGYGHLGPYFIKKFKTLYAAGHTVALPEGLHRFYLQGTYGKVGASWMTKEARETDIQDYLAYLDLFLREIRAQHPSSRIHLLGFSQGAATASRWFAHSDFHFASLVLYSGVFANDFDFQINAEKLHRSGCLLTIGDNDEFVTMEEIDKRIELIKAQGYTPDVHIFRGKHEVTPEVLQRVLEWEEAR